MTTTTAGTTAGTSRRTSPATAQRPRGQVPGHLADQSRVARYQVPADDVSRDYSRNVASRNDASRNQVSRNQVSRNQVSRNQVSRDGIAHLAQRPEATSRRRTSLATCPVTSRATPPRGTSPATARAADRPANRDEREESNHRRQLGICRGRPDHPEIVAVRRLGGGAAYDAYLAFDEVTWGPVVVKVLRPAQVANPASLRGLRREVAALEAVNHPVVVRKLRHSFEKDRPHVVLESIDGPRLSTLLRRYGPLQPAQYLPLAIDIASALQYLRHIGHVHLDIKPSNVIMGAPARLIDLSLARPEPEAAALDHPIGTDAYMAPEQADPPRTGSPTYASDVFGLSATLFEAMAGYRPSTTATPKGPRRRISGHSWSRRRTTCPRRCPRPSRSWCSPAWTGNRRTARPRSRSPRGWSRCTPSFRRGGWPASRSGDPAAQPMNR